MVDFEKIYRKSFDIAINNKPLWVIGIVVSILAGGGCNSSQNLDIPSDSGDFSEIQKNLNTQKVEELFNLLLNILKSIPIWVWFVLVISLLIAFVIGFIFNLVVRNWAIGSLVGGINAAYSKKEVSLKTSSRYGLKSLRSLIWLNIVPWFLYFLLLLIPGIIILFCFVLFFPLGILALMFIGFFSMIGFLAIAATQIWATRVAVIEEKSGKESFFQGWDLFKKQFLNTIILGCLNTCLGCLSGCAFGCIIGLVILPFFTAGASFYYLSANKSLFISILIFMILIFGLPFILINMLFNGIYTVFNYSTWNVLYRQVRDGENNESK